MRVSWAHIPLLREHNASNKSGSRLPFHQGNRRGIVAFTSACALFAVSDTLTKLTALIYPSAEVLFSRGVGSMLCVATAMAYTHQLSKIAAVARPMVILRAALDATANAVFVFAVTRMRLADLLAINLASPVLTTMMLALFFREPVGWRRWTAIMVSFTGMLIIVRPSASLFNVWALLAVMSPFASALRDIVTRRIEPHVPTLAITFVSLVTITMASPIMALGLGETWTSLDPKYLVFMTAAAIVLSAGSTLAVSAFRNVDVSVVASFRYSILLWGALSGYFIFDEVPDRWSLLGCVLIVGSGLYTLHREQV